MPTEEEYREYNIAKEMTDGTHHLPASVWDEMIAKIEYFEGKYGDAMFRYS